MPTTNEAALAAPEPLRELSRERLNELIWTLRPAQMCAVVGASRDATLRACKTMQIPIPPCGFWRQTKISGEVPPLPEFKRRAAILVVQPIFNATLRQKSREQLYEAVWTTTITALAKDWGLSDSAVLKRCRALAVPVPGRGYWAKVRAGKTPLRPPLPPAPPTYEERRRREVEQLREHDERSKRAQTFRELTDQQFAEFTSQFSGPQLCSLFGVGRTSVNLRCKKMGIAIPRRRHPKVRDSATAATTPKSVPETVTSVSASAEHVAVGEVAESDATAHAPRNEASLDGRSVPLVNDAPDVRIPPEWLPSIEAWVGSNKTPSPARRTQLINGLSALRQAGLLPSLTTLQDLSKEQVREACERLTRFGHSEGSIRTYRSAVNVFKTHLSTADITSPSERASLIDKLLNEKNHSDRKCRYWELLRDLAITSMVALDQFSATEIITLPTGPGGLPTSQSRICAESQERLKRYYDALPQDIRAAVGAPFFVTLKGEPMYRELVARLLSRLCLSACVDRLKIEDLRTYGREAQRMRALSSGPQPEPRLRVCNGALVEGTDMQGDRAADEPSMPSLLLF